MALLEVKGMGISFGGLRAVHGYDLSIDPGQIVGLIGPNGAGKTTIFNLITGIYRPSDGEVLLEGRSIVGLAPHRIAASGLGRTFQEMKLWRHMSVLEHLKLAMYSRIDYGLAGAFFGTSRRTRREREFEDEAMSLLRMLRVDRHAAQLVTNLSYGEQRRVEIARALATGPKLLCLDEPAAGMNASEKVSLLELIRKIRDLFGLANFGVNRTRLVPGGSSALRHAHTKQDEFVYILEGHPTLHTDEGRMRLAPGMCAGFKAGTGNGHRLINETDEDVVYLEIGDRSAGDDVTYPDDDMEAAAGPDGGPGLHP